MDLCAHSTSTTSLPLSLSMPLFNEYSTSLQAMKRTYSWSDYKQATPHGFPKNLDLRALDPVRQTSWEFGGVENATSINRGVSPVASTPNTRTSTSVDVNSTGLATTTKYEEMENDSRSHEPEKVPSPIQLGASGADFILTSVDGTPSAASRAIGNVDPVISMGTARITIIDTKDATRANPGISINSTNDALDDTRSKISNEHANPKFTSRVESSAIAARVAPPPGSCTVAPAPYHPEFKQPRPPHSINPVPNIGPVSTPFNTPFLPSVASYLPHPKFKPPQTNTRIAGQHEIVTPGHIQASLHLAGSDELPPVTMLHSLICHSNQPSATQRANWKASPEPRQRGIKRWKAKLLVELDMKRQKQKASKMGGLLGFGPIPRPRPPQHHGSALGLLVCSEPPEPSPMIGDTPDLNTAPLDLRSAPQSQEETAARANNNDPTIEASDLDLGAEPTSDIGEYLKVSWHPVILEMLDEVEKALADWSCGCDCLWVRE
ncbi:hypothetical protein BD779DRAFT_352481 [Infundibulicybe gibba]|nr:hypothetical protein BD779DRAFT_352481 [Infundibulicybe gibba]